MSHIATDQIFMCRALELASNAQAHGEVPVGAVVVFNGKVLGEGWNQPISTHDPTAHAEVIALRAACIKLQNYRLTDTTLYVTLEPCLMCVGAIIHARVARVVYGASDPKIGAASSLYSLVTSDRLNHQVEVVGGVLADECGTYLREFFRARR